MIMRQRAAARSTASNKTCGHGRVCSISLRRMRREEVPVVEADYPLNQLHYSRVPIFPITQVIGLSQQLIKLALPLTQRECATS